MAASNPLAPAGATDLATAALAHLRALQAAGVSAALIDHEGGHRHSVGSPLDLPSFGNIGGALLTLGDTLVRQAGTRVYDHIVVSAAEQQIVALPVGDTADHLLVVVVPRALALGPVLWAARRGCAELRDAESAAMAAVIESSTRPMGDKPETAL